ncbi:hypothetical protein THASP1DRAFT_31175 [Thamnocephalis sphaerospora]|uniref:Uncharacterized protein n=1 Tax=Thamnocephalis sphaerospora TaxID=78915 RepID=A0A4P9XM75_9FUNG|nr:hypothetical protein THASP1DRAFT_31175 [Thamnocephalis sphaerospora]|eukprot:RKP07007.1 hypothetical protein THASP1DRAFT_31175 [Thamnocephalis sphaerospora]
MIAFSAGMMLYLALGDLFPVAVMGWESHFADNDNWKRAAGTISVGILAAAILVIYLAKHLVRTLRQKHDASMFAAVVGLHAVASNDFQKATLSATAAKQSASANDDGAAADGSDHSAVTNADTPAAGFIQSKK